MKLNTSFHMFVKWTEVAQSCPTLCDPMDTRLLRPWDFLGKSTGVDCHFLLQGIFLTQGSNPDLLRCGQTLYRLSHHLPIMFPSHEMPVQFFCPLFYGVVFFLLISLSFLYIKASHFVVGYLCCKYLLPVCAWFLCSCNEASGWRDIPVITWHSLLTLPSGVSPHALSQPSCLVWASAPGLCCFPIWPTFFSSILSQNTRPAPLTDSFPFPCESWGPTQMPPPTGSLLRLPQKSEWNLSFPPLFWL